MTELRSQAVNLEGLSRENRERIAQGMGIIGTHEVEVAEPSPTPAPLMSIDNDGLAFIPYRSQGSSITL